MYVNILQTGGTVEQVIADMVASPEYATLTNNNSTDFVQGLYSALLGRAGSSQRREWLRERAAADRRAGVVNNFLNSVEYRMDEVQQLYGSPLAALTSVPSVFPDLLHRARIPGGDRRLGQFRRVNPPTGGVFCKRPRVLQPGFHVDRRRLRLSRQHRQASLLLPSPRWGEGSGVRGFPGSHAPRGNRCPAALRLWAASAPTDAMIAITGRPGQRRGASRQGVPTPSVGTREM